AWPVARGSAGCSTSMRATAARRARSRRVKPPDPDVPRADLGDPVDDRAPASELLRVQMRAPGQVQQRFRDQPNIHSGGSRTPIPVWVFGFARTRARLGGNTQIAGKHVPLPARPVRPRRIESGNIAIVISNVGRVEDEAEVTTEILLWKSPPRSPSR